jgi:acetylornithine aminotransferase/acetylornithine/N-succinyldiaminopimelate aminotransferase
VRDAITPATAAILIEGVQGEGGIAPASQEYLLGLRQLCDERRMLLLMDGVQCGHFRTGRFQSFQRILETASNTSAPTGFLPDGISMAKSLGGGFPIGAFWVREEHHGVKLCDLLGPGTHATTYGGTPLGCAVANKVFEVIERDRLADNARETGAWMKAELEKLSAQFPQVIKGVRGLGFMLGIELSENIPAFANTGKVASLNFVNRLHEAGVLTVPSGTHVVRFLPALNLSRADAAQGVDLIGRVVRAVA